MPTDGELASAAGDGNAAEVEKLLWAGAKIEEKDTDRDTLLQAPARKMRAVLAVINTQLLRSTVLKDMNLDKNSPIVVAAVALYIAVFLTCGLLAVPLFRHQADHAFRYHWSPPPASLMDSLQFTSPFAAVVAVAATALLLLLARVDRHETKDGSTPLLLAAQNGHAEVVQLLLKAGADTSTMDTDGLTPLHFAVSNGHAAVVKLLLDAGADISGTDKNAKNWIALADVVRTANPWRIIPVFLALMVFAPFTKWEKTMCAMLVFFAWLFVEASQYFEEKRLLAKGSALLRIALAGGQSKVVRGLLQAGADKNAPIATEAGIDWRFLAVTAAVLAVPCLRMVVSLRSVTDGKPPTNFYILMSCFVWWGSLRLVANVPTSRRTPLRVLQLRETTMLLGIVPLAFMAVWYVFYVFHYERAPQKLTLLGIAVSMASTLFVYFQRHHIDTAVKDGATPLHLAVLHGRAEVVRVLLDEGAHVSAKNKDGATPLHIAAHQGHTKVVQLLLKAGAATNAMDNDGYTPLHTASYFFLLRTEVVELLLKAGADVFAEDQDENTPLHVAASCGHVEVVRVLLVWGADITAENLKGETPLHVAAFARGEVGREEVVEVLLGEGADSSAKNKFGETPLHHAHGAVVKKLLRKAPVDKAAAEYAATAKQGRLNKAEKSAFEKNSAENAHAAKQGRRDKAAELDAWLHETCKIDNETKRTQVLDLFVDPRYEVNSPETFRELDQKDFDTILAPLPLATRRLVTSAAKRTVKRAGGTLEDDESPNKRARVNATE